MSSLQKMWKENTVGVVIMGLIVIAGIYYFMNYLNNKGSFGSEPMQSSPQRAYKNSAPLASDPAGQNETFAKVSGSPTADMLVPGASNMQNPSDLLPKSSGSWAALNPSGKGELQNINLLQAGYHIGIDTIGQTLRNANLQIRSEPPNPQTYVGPWQQSTISPDLLRPPLEIGAGGLQ